MPKIIHSRYIGEFRILARGLIPFDVNSANVCDKITCFDMYDCIKSTESR